MWDKDGIVIQVSDRELTDGTRAGVNWGHGRTGKDEPVSLFDLAIGQ